MIKFIGRNSDFIAFWNCDSQYYTVYKNNKYLTKAFKFSDIKSYLN